MLYPYQLDVSDDGKTYSATVVDFGATIQGTSIDDVTEKLRYAFPLMVEEGFRKKRKAIPAPSTREDGQGILYIPIKLQLRILLWNRLRKLGMTTAELGRRIGVSRQRAQEFVNGSDAVSVEGYEKALRILDAQPNVSLEIVELEG